MKERGSNPNTPGGPDKTAVLSQKDSGDLPLLAVDRAAEDHKKPRRRTFLSGLKKLRFIPLVVLLIGIGGFIGLYFQPPGLQKFMQITGLEPGAGTSHPIALPVDRSPESPSKDTLPDTIVGLGKLIPDGDVTIVAMPSQAGDARVAQLHVIEW